MMKSKINQNILKSLVLGALGSLAIACLFLIQPVQSLMKEVDAIGSAQAPDAVTISAGVYADNTCSGTPIATDASPVAPTSAIVYCYFLTNSGSYTFPSGYNIIDSLGSSNSVPGPFTIGTPITFYNSISPTGNINKTVVVTFSGNIPSGNGFVPYVVTNTVTAYVMSPAVGLIKTVGLSASCSATNTLTIPLGTAPVAVYCYKIVNTGNVPITITGLSDNKVAAIGARTNLIFPSNLPRNTTLTGVLVYELVTSTITNTAIVTAEHAVANALLASPLTSSAQASVLFISPKPAIQLNVYLTTGSDCATASSDNITIVSGTPIKFCYAAKNIGDTTLYTHTLVANGSNIFAGSLITLPVGSTTIYSRGPISISKPADSDVIYHQATWTGSEILGFSGSSSEGATIRFGEATPTPTPRPGFATSTPTITPTPLATATPSTPTDIVASISGPTNGSPSTIFSYTIRILNNSVTTASGLVFTNTLPTNASFQGVTRGSGITCPTMPSVGDIGGTIVCNITGTLVSGQFDELSVTMRPIDSTNINTSVTASTTTYETNRANTVATFIVRLEPLKFFIPFVPSLLKN